MKFPSNFDFKFPLHFDVTMPFKYICLQLSMKIPFLNLELLCSLYNSMLNFRFNLELNCPSSLYFNFPLNYWIKMLFESRMVKYRLYMELTIPFVKCHFTHNIYHSHMSNNICHITIDSFIRWMLSYTTFIISICQMTYDIWRLTIPYVKRHLIYYIWHFHKSNDI